MDALTSKQKQDFLAKLKSTNGNVSRAARAAKISRAGAYVLKNKDADFAAAWDDVLASVYDEMEQELYRRAVTGWKEPVFYKGDKIADIRKKSDRLLEFALKGNRAEKFRERFDVNQNIAGVLDLNIQATINQIYADPDSPDSEPEAESPAVDTGTD